MSPFFSLDFTAYPSGHLFPSLYTTILPMAYLLFGADLSQFAGLQWPNLLDFGPILDSLIPGSFLLY